MPDNNLRLVSAAISKNRSINPYKNRCPFPRNRLRLMILRPGLRSDLSIRLAGV
ncbi:hypothetical protein [Bacillus thuringiensis]|uniref:hypothetical protein n=1 Tax=Bacillus thuringiensis TaxID=1428 RepID=UPI0020D23DB6|nr:hypothetical protein [Bacillus thuringiensis]